MPLKKNERVKKERARERMREMRSRQKLQRPSEDEDSAANADCSASTSPTPPDTPKISRNHCDSDKCHQGPPDGLSLTISCGDLPMDSGRISPVTVGPGPQGPMELGTILDSIITLLDEVDSKDEIDSKTDKGSQKELSSEKPLQTQSELSSEKECPKTLNEEGLNKKTDLEYVPNSDLLEKNPKGSVEKDTFTDLIGTNEADYDIKSRNASPGKRDTSNRDVKVYPLRNPSPDSKSKERQSMDVEDIEDDVDKEDPDESVDRQSDSLSTHSNSSPHRDKGRRYSKEISDAESGTIRKGGHHSPQFKRAIVRLGDLNCSQCNVLMGPKIWWNKHQKNSGSDSNVGSSKKTTTTSSDESDSEFQPVQAEAKNSFKGSKDSIPDGCHGNADTIATFPSRNDILGQRGKPRPKVSSEKSTNCENDSDSDDEILTKSSRRFSRNSSQRSEEESVPMIPKKNSSKDDSSSDSENSDGNRSKTDKDLASSSSQKVLQSRGKPEVTDKSTKADSDSDEETVVRSSRRSSRNSLQPSERDSLSNSSKKKLLNQVANSKDGGKIEDSGNKDRQRSTDSSRRSSRNSSVQSSPVKTSPSKRGRESSTAKSDPPQVKDGSTADSDNEGSPAKKRRSDSKDRPNSTIAKASKADDVIDFSDTESIEFVETAHKHGNKRKAATFDEYSDDVPLNLRRNTTSKKSPVAMVTSASKSSLRQQNSGQKSEKPKNWFRISAEKRTISESSSEELVDNTPMEIRWGSISKDPKLGQGNIVVDLTDSDDGENAVKSCTKQSKKPAAPSKKKSFDYLSPETVDSDDTEKGVENQQNGRPSWACKLPLDGQTHVADGRNLATTKSHDVASPIRSTLDQKTDSKPPFEESLQVLLCRIDSKGCRKCKAKWGKVKLAPRQRNLSSTKPTRISPIEAVFTDSSDDDGHDDNNKDDDDDGNDDDSDAEDRKRSDDLMKELRRLPRSGRTMATLVPGNKEPHLQRTKQFKSGKGMPDKNYLCNICGYRINRGYIFEQHLATHEKEQPKGKKSAKPKSTTGTHQQQGETTKTLKYLTIDIPKSINPGGGTFSGVHREDANKTEVVVVSLPPDKKILNPGKSSNAAGLNTGNINVTPVKKLNIGKALDTTQAGSGLNPVGIPTANETMPFPAVVRGPKPSLPVALAPSRGPILYSPYTITVPAVSMLQSPDEMEAQVQAELKILREQELAVQRNIMAHQARLNSLANMANQTLGIASAVEQISSKLVSSVKDMVPMGPMIAPSPMGSIVPNTTATTTMPTPNLGPIKNIGIPLSTLPMMEMRKTRSSRSASSTSATTPTERATGAQRAKAPSPQIPLKPVVQTYSKPFPTGLYTRAEKPDNTDDAEDEFVECDMCEKWFKTKDFLDKHKLKKHGINPPPCITPVQGLVPFTSSSSGSAVVERGDNQKSTAVIPSGERRRKSTESMSVLSSVPRIFDTNVCNSFGNSPDIQLECTNCDETFDSSEALKQHLKRKHTVWLPL